MRAHRRATPVLLASAAALIGFIGVPELAQACAVCGVGREENRMAFLLTTIFLSILPLLAIGGIVGWLRHRSKVVERESLHESSEAGGHPAPSTPAR
jgi:hypothetical protein